MIQLAVVVMLLGAGAASAPLVKYVHQITQKIMTENLQPMVLICVLYTIIDTTMKLVKLCGYVKDKLKSPTKSAEESRTKSADEETIEGPAVFHVKDSLVWHSRHCKGGLGNACPGRITKLRRCKWCVEQEAQQKKFR